MTLDLHMIRRVYRDLPEKIERSMKITQRPLTLTEKILYSHLAQPTTRPFSGGKDYVEFHPDRVAMQDATAQMALLQLMSAGKKKVAVPSTVHCDHLIQARDRALADLKNAQTGNQEVFDFLASVSRKYRIGFWKPGTVSSIRLYWKIMLFPEE